MTVSTQYNILVSMCTLFKLFMMLLCLLALQGADFGREVGQWFGPNNVAQAIK